MYIHFVHLDKKKIEDRFSRNNEGIDSFRYYLNEAQWSGNKSKVTDIDGSQSLLFGELLIIIVQEKEN